MARGDFEKETARLDDRAEGMQKAKQTGGLSK